MTITSTPKCECGCGQTPPQARQAIKALGLRKGDFRRYVAGHHIKNAHAARRKIDLDGLLEQGVRTESGCLEWPFNRSPRGYGKMRVGYRHVRVHRVVLERKIGRPLLDGECALHRCDNPPCFEPEHLFVGTQKENVADCISKGRFSNPPKHYELPKGIYP